MARFVALALMAVLLAGCAKREQECRSHLGALIPGIAVLDLRETPIAAEGRRKGLTYSVEGHGTVPFGSIGVPVLILCQYKQEGLH